MHVYQRMRGPSFCRGGVSFAGALMSEATSEIRGRTLLAGKIVSDFGQSSIDCVVRRLSDRGATVTAESPLGIPKRFHLLISNEASPRPARRVW